MFTGLFLIIIHLITLLEGNPEIVSFKNVQYVVQEGQDGPILHT